MQPLCWHQVCWWHHFSHSLQFDGSLVLHNFRVLMSCLGYLSRTCILTRDESICILEFIYVFDHYKCFSLMILSIHLLCSCTSGPESILGSIFRKTQRKVSLDAIFFWVGVIWYNLYFSKKGRCSSYHPLVDNIKIYEWDWKVKLIIPPPVHQLSPFAPL